MGVNDYILKEQSSLIKNLSFYLKKLFSKREKKYIASRRKVIIKTAKINEIINWKTTEKKWSKNLVLWKAFKNRKTTS